MDINVRQISRSIMYSGLLLLLGMTFPLLLLLVPVPFIITRLDSTNTDALIACMGLFLINLLFMGMIPALGILLFNFMIFLPIGEFMNDGAEDYLTITVTSLGILLGVSIVTASLYFFHDIYLIDSFRSSFHEVLDLFSREAPNMNAYIKDIRSMEDVIVQSLPSFIVTTAFVSSFLNLQVARNRVKNPRIILRRRPFNSFRISLKVLGVLGIFIFGFYILARTEIDYGDFLFLNGFAILSNFLIFNGLTVADYFSRKLPKFVRVLIPILIFIFGFSIVYIFLGALDSLLNLRQKMPKKWSRDV